MRSFILAAALLGAASPAFAANGPFIEVGGGINDARSNDVDQTIDYTSVEFRPQATTPPPQDTFVDDVFGTRSKPGFDATVAAGYDFGWLRLEGELGRRQVRTSRIADDDASAEFLGQLNANLNRPSAAPDPGAPELPALTVGDFQRPGHIRATSAMFNSIVDVELFRRMTLFAGAGIGRSWVRGFGDKDSARAYQYMLGLRFPLGERLELGVKHRYFSSGIVTLDDDPLSFAGNPNSRVGPERRNRLTNATVSQRFEGEWRTRSVQLTLGYKF